ncbi:hypothetical protein EFS32_11605 [Levilactobacillus parabrevis]|nr:hypothetical protein [Levilactobacillus parabrevis]
MLVYLSRSIAIGLKRKKFESPNYRDISYQRENVDEQPNWIKVSAKLANGTAIDIIGVKVRIEKETTPDLSSRKDQLEWICSQNSKTDTLIMLGDLNYGPHRTEYLNTKELNWQDIIDMMRHNQILNVAYPKDNFIEDSPYSPYSPFGSSFKNEQIDWLVAKNVRINRDSSYNQLDWSFGRHNTQSFKNGYLVPQGYFIRTDPAYPDHAIFTAEISVPSEEEKTVKK